jgi:hypothetical protein
LLFHLAPAFTTIFVFWQNMTGIFRQSVMRILSNSKTMRLHCSHSGLLWNSFTYRLFILVGKASFLCSIFSNKWLSFIFNEILFSRLKLSTLYRRNFYLKYETLMFYFFWKYRVSSEYSNQMVFFFDRLLPRLTYIFSIFNHILNVIHLSP